MAIESTLRDPRLPHSQHTPTRDQSFGIQRKQEAAMGSVYLILEYVLEWNNSFNKSWKNS